MQKTNWMLVACCLAGLCECPGASRVAQAQAIQIFGTNPDAGGPLPFATDPTLKLRMTRAEQLIKDEKYAEAVQHLQAILDYPEDFFFLPRDADSKSFRGMKSEAQRRLQQLPPAARAAYELQFGAEARSLLGDAVEAGNLQDLAEVARRYFHTRAGYEAMLLLGNAYMDRGHPLAAALCYERLLQIPQVADVAQPMLGVKTALCWLQAGMQPEADRVLLDLKHIRGGSIGVGGEDVPLFTDAADGRAWLLKTFEVRIANLAGQEQWPMQRGNASRSAPSVGGAPFLRGQWQLSTAKLKLPSEEDPLTDTDVDLSKTLTRLRENYGSQSLPLLPAQSPLVIGKTVLVRTYSQLKALDLDTGTELWRSIETDPTLVQLRHSAIQSQTQDGAEVDLEDLLKQRAWEDATFGTLSSDGDYVYCLDDLGFWGRYSANPAQPHPLAPKDYNRLTAYEIRTGKLKWEDGGPGGATQLEAAGNFFLGPPLPFGRQLYALTETNNEVRLMVLEPRTGEVNWSQTLVSVQGESIVQDSRRRMAGLSPSADEGVLVCPTGVGAVVAVDLTTRTLLWAYSYGEQPPGDPRQQRMIMMRMQRPQMRNSAPPETNRWLDSAVILDSSRVLVTPPDSDFIHCLNLVDGTFLWKKPRGQNLYVAGVDKQKVLLVGSRQMEALRLSDGSAVWKEPARIAMPSGRGFLTEGLYHVPLSTGEVATIDVENGRILTSSKSRDGVAPGNFVGFGGIVLSQGPTGITGFRPLKALKEETDAALAVNSDDPAALAMRGEIRLNEGALALAYADLRRSLELNALPETRALLFESLLEGLRTDFASYRESLAELEQLVGTPQQRGAYLRVLAAGLQAAGESKSAFDVYLRLAGTDVGEPGLEKIDGSISVRRDRWVGAQLTALYEKAEPAGRAAMDQDLKTRLETAVQTRNPDELRVFLAHFGTHPLADNARQALVDSLIGEGLSLELEALLRKLEASAVPETAAGAAARLSQLLIKAGQTADAVYALPKLAGPWAEVVCLDGKTGKQLADEWKTDPDLILAAAGAADWPTGAVESVRKDGKNTNNYMFPIAIGGPRGPFFEDLMIAMDNRQRSVLGTDGLGREVWRIALPEGSAYFNPYGTHGRVHNHVVLLALGSQVVAVDTLARESGGKDAKLLWKEDLLDPASAAQRNLGQNVRQVMLPGGGMKFIVTDQSGQPLGTLGSVGSEYVCFQRGRQLRAVELLTGKLLWQRHDVAAGSEMFGDDELLFVVAPNVDETLVLRASDGHQLGTRTLPDSRSRTALFGRHVLTWTAEENRPALSLIDLWTEKPVWKQDFAKGSQMALIEEDQAAVVEPTGRFVLLQIPDGKVQIDDQIAVGANLSQIRLVRSRDHYVLLTGTIVNMQLQNKVFAFGYNNPVIDGLAHGYDRRTGKKIWSQPIVKQGLDLAQPLNLPVLILASRIQEQVPLANGQITYNWTYHVQALDKRTGRIVLDTTDKGTMNTIDVAADPARKLVSINIPGPNPALFELTFTDKAEAPAVPEAEKASDGK